MIKIVYIIEKFPCESEHFILNEILELEKQKFNIIILALRKTEKFFINSEFSTLKSQIIYLPSFLVYVFSLNLFTGFKEKLHIYNNLCFKKSTSLKIFLRKTQHFFIALYYANKIKKLDIAHIHAHFAFIAADIACILSKLLGIDFSFTAHAQDIYINKNDIIPKIGMAKFIITCNVHNEILLEDIKKSDNSKKKIFAIYHGINIKKWPYIEHNLSSHNPIKIITVARLVEKKGIIYGINAVKILIDRGYNVSYIIVGDGILDTELKEYVKLEKLEKYIIFLGYKSQDDIYNLMVSSDIFILPCIEAQNGDMDGLPNVLLEALAVGLPVVSSKISAIKELIIHKETGLLVSPKDTMELSEAIIYLLSNNNLYNKLSNNGRKKIEMDFNIDISTTKLKNVFEEYILE